MLIGGQDMTNVRRRPLRDVTFVFQQYSLYPHLNGLRQFGFPAALADAQARAGTRDQAPGHGVSRSMLRIEQQARQSCATEALRRARCSAWRSAGPWYAEPAVTLMDEPLSSLDAKLRNDLRLELKRIQQDLGATMLYVTHDQTEAMTLASRIGVLEKGVLVQVGTPQQIYRDPVSAYVAARLGSPRINLMPRSAVGTLAAPPETATVGVRPDAMRLKRANGHDSGHVQALVRRIEHLGDQKHVHVALGEVELITLCPDPSGFEPGRAVSVEFTAPLFFDAAGRRIPA